MKSTIIKESLIEFQPIPIDIEGTKLILSQMENCICKIYQNDKTGTGFFCRIPFPDKNNLLNVLITNNHILNEKDIENNKSINLIMYNKEEKIKREIKIDESRKRFTYINKEEGIDITIIEIKKKEDNINNFLEIDDNVLEIGNEILELESKRKSIYILHYPKDKRLVSYGLIKNIAEDKKIYHYCNTEEGSSGSPILSLNNFKVIGVHYAGSNVDNIKLNYGTYLKYIIKEFNNKYKSSNKSEINLIYFTKKEGIFDIFGNKFIKNNKNNVDLIINGIENKLIKEYKLKKGENNIKLIIKNRITNLEYMFYECSCLKNIDGLKYLDTKDVNNFECMFSGCSSISDISGLKNWNVSNANYFEYMFKGCSSLSDINGLINWNVSNVNNFGGMFCGCSSLSNINGLVNWNVSNAEDFTCMFSGCSSLSNINELKNWNVSKVKDFTSMFYKCSSLSDIDGLKNWNVSNGKDFYNMFNGCSSSLNLEPIKNWKLSKYKYESMK